jgi:DNA-binding NarL/FixJ family response regulator
MADPVRSARDAYRKREWSRAVELFHSAATQSELSPDDMNALGDAAWWLGRIEISNAAYIDAYRQQVDAGRHREAAMSAIGVAVNLLLRGDDVLGLGWLARAERLLEADKDCTEYGYLLHLSRVEAAFDSNAGLDDALAAAREVQELGRRHGNADLVAAGIMGEGRILIKQGRVFDGLALLDEVLVLLLTERLSPEWAGDVYCNLMVAASELVDVKRAAAWTEATARWLQTIDAAVLFTGICRVHRAQVHTWRGAWDLAEREARLVCADLADIQPSSAAEAHYQLGEIRRLRGDLAGTEQAYDAARHLGGDTQPGLAMLHLAREQFDVAVASINAAVAAAPDPLTRARLRAAQTEIALADGDTATADAASTDLAEIAETFGSSGLLAMAEQARGAVQLASGSPDRALRLLHEALRRWQAVEAHHECASVRLLLSRAYRTLGDSDSAAREQATAAATLARLGVPAHVTRPAVPGGLTTREAEVLALVAAGKSNREVAAALVVSEKTVARHLSNIFNKLGVSSRTAATAFAFEHGLVTGAGR